MTTTTNETIFFSYSRADQAFTMKLARDLRTAGANLWLDQLDIEAGVRWDHAIEEALETAGTLLVILSPTSVVSQNVMDEVSYALEEGKQIVPVLYQPCKIPFRLRRVQYIDFSDDFEKGFSHLLFALGIVNETRSGRFRSFDIPALPEDVSPHQRESSPDDDPAQAQEATSTVARSRRRRGHVLKGVFSVVGVAAALVAGVVLAPLLGFQLIASENVPPMKEEQAAPAAPRAATFTVLPESLSMEMGVLKKLQILLLDTTGTPIGQEQLDQYDVEWKISDDLAELNYISDTDVNVTGWNPGSTVITVKVKGIGPTLLSQKIPVTIRVSQKLKMEADQAFSTANRHRSDPSIPNADVLAEFKTVRSEHGEALDAGIYAFVDSTISHLQHEIKAYSQVDILDRSDTLTVPQRWDLWQAYVEQADRKSPATTRAQQKLDTLSQVKEHSATVVDNTLVTCRSIGNKQCATSQIARAFQPRQTVYVSAKIHAPKSEKITVQWFNPSGEQINQKKSTISTSPGYRIWYSLSGSETEQKGTYEIRIHNSDDHLIGQLTFTVG